MSYLHVGGLTFRYGDRLVLDEVRFDVAEGEIMGLLGPNGAGKSTLFSLLVGLLPSQRGELALGGERIRPGDRLIRTKVGVVFQSMSLDLKLSARENLLLQAALHCVPKRVAAARAQELLELVELYDRADEQVGRYSGGMRRRLEIVRALMQKPRLLIMDEPTVGLDEAAFQRTWARLRALASTEKLTMVLTTHRPEEAERCDRLAVLSGGRIVACETPDALRARVSGDMVVVSAAQPEEVATLLGSKLGLTATVRNDRGGHSVWIEHARGHELIPRVVEAFPPGRLDAVSLRRPSLGDAFLKITGRQLEHDEDAILPADAQPAKTAVAAEVHA